MQLLVEGGATVAGEFHRRGLVNRYIAYLAPAFMGGSDGTPLFSGNGAPSIADLRRGRFVRVTPVGGDLEIVVDPSIVRSSHD